MNRICKTIAISLLVICNTTTKAQLPDIDTAQFDHFELGMDTFLNDAGELGFFEDQNILLPNDYDVDFDAWQGWAISNMTDTETRGFANQYSAITGGGFYSDSYVVAGAFQGSVIKFSNGQTVSLGLMVTNSTYAYYSMLEGDAFAKRFGGESGNDPDFFLLSVKAYYGDSLSTDSITLYLADYRFEDNSMDFIVNQWTYVDLTPLGQSDSLLLQVWSSDTSAFGINTPAYFCMDHLVYQRPMTTSIADHHAGARIFGNPVEDQIKLEWPGSSRRYVLVGSDGRNMATGNIIRGMNTIDVRNIGPGVYVLKIENGESYRIIKT